MMLIVLEARYPRLRPHLMRISLSWLNYCPRSLASPMLIGRAKKNDCSRPSTWATRTGRGKEKERRSQDRRSRDLPRRPCTPCTANCVKSFLYILPLNTDRSATSTNRFFLYNPEFSLCCPDFVTPCFAVLYTNT